MTDDLARAVEFAGCERIVARFSGADLCLPHQQQNAGWPCRETVRVLELIWEVRADECEDVGRWLSLDDGLLKKALDHRAKRHREKISDE